MKLNVRYFSACIAFCFAIAGNAQLVNRFSIDLTTSKKGRLSVACEVPTYNKDTLIYQIPRAVPGTYSIKNYGRYITNFKAFDAQGKKLKSVYNESSGSFTILGAAMLAGITYDVHETWTDSGNPDYIFQPGGTYFESGTLFFLNTFALFGYFDGFTDVANEIHIRKNSSLFCSTSADISSLSPEEDVVKAVDYNTLQDNPLVYLKPDTVSIRISNCRFHIAVFSRNGKITSRQVLTSLYSVLTRALPAFFPVFPTDNYTFTFVFPGWQDNRLMASGSMGAMEHRQSSVYFFGETGNPDVLNSFIRQVVAHEFLHVLTPLSLQSEQVFHFDYRHPEGSEHLWMYEGCVEYLSNLILYRDSVFSADDFWEAIRDKTLYNGRFSNLSMTELGKHIFENKNMSYYVNVYNKGALVSFLLDIGINELTNGKLNLRKLLMQLDTKYKGRYFNDKELFDEMVNATNPALREVIDDYIIGTKELPMKEYLHKIGYRFLSEKPDSIYTFGRVSFEYNAQKNRCEARDALPYYNAFKMNDGDVLVAVNDTLLTEANYYHFVKTITSPTTNRDVTVRYSNKGKLSEVQNPPIKLGVVQRNFIEPEENVSEEQIRLRKMVLGR